MNINAKQMTSIDATRMDITTVLGYFIQIRSIIAKNAPLAAALGTVWTTFTEACDDFDDSYAQARKWAQTIDIESLDKQRDTALSAFLAALKAMTSSPNESKQAAAKYLMFLREKYTLSSSDEYMKATTAINQMIQEMEDDEKAAAGLALTGLDDWFEDLKAKNQSFLQKVNERTEAQAGQQKGIVREKRLVAEYAYRNMVKLINAAAIMELPAGVDFASAIDRLNAEVEHFRLILARKGVSTGTNAGGDGSDDNENEGDNSSGSGSGGSSDGGDDSGNGSGGSSDGNGDSGSGNGGSSDDNGGSGSGSGGGNDSGGGSSDDGGGNSGGGNVLG